MTVPIEISSVPIQRVVRGFSRYSKQNVIFYGEQKFITFDTYLRTPYVPNGQERVMLIKKGVEYRPDLVAYDIYGTPDLWWKIMEANNMKDILEFKSGVTILLPDELF